MQQMAFVVSNAEEGIKKIKQFADIGFTDILLIYSGPDRNNLVNLLSEEKFLSLGEGNSITTKQSGRYFKAKAAL